MNLAWIGLGSNLGDRLATLSAAVRRLAELPQTSLAAVSPLYASAPEDPNGGPTAGPEYLNAVAALRSALAPRALLWHLLYIEAELGRRRGGRHRDRMLDLDLLAVGDLVIQEADLVVPHPRLGGRAFVVRPWLDLAAEWRTPDGRRLAELAAAAGVAQQVADWFKGEWRFLA